MNRIVYVHSFECMSIDMNAWMCLIVEHEIVLVMFWIIPFLTSCLHLEGYAMLFNLNDSFEWVVCNSS
jgi:hypothetical protein